MTSSRMFSDRDVDELELICMVCPIEEVARKARPKEQIIFETSMGSGYSLVFLK